MSLMDRIKGMFSGGAITKSAPEIKVDKAILLDKIRQTDLFKGLPDENLNEMFAHMETVSLGAGEEIITQGAEGDYYYLLAEGTAKVVRDNEVVAQFDEPKGFGEEALISNAKRNATITMTSAGAVMRLSKDAFNDFVKEPTVDWYSPGEAQKKIADGAKWLDVRDEDEAAQDRLHGSLSVPMSALREKFVELDKESLYICYCENGRLSSTAAFLMRQSGFKVGVLRGGLKSLKQAGIA